RGQLRGAAREPAVGVHPPLPGKPPGFERGGVVRLPAARRGAGGGAGHPRQEGDGSGPWGLGESGNRGVSVPQSTPAEARRKHRRLKVLSVGTARLALCSWGKIGRKIGRLEPRGLSDCSNDTSAVPDGRTRGKRNEGGEKPIGKAITWRTDWA